MIKVIIMKCIFWSCVFSCALSLILLKLLLLNDLYYIFTGKYIIKMFNEAGAYFVVIIHFIIMFIILSVIQIEYEIIDK
jgi:hypothetical protein